jgi:hypothetical protein
MPLRRACSVLALACAIAPLTGADAPAITGSDEYVQEMAALQALTAERDLELYEFAFTPLTLDRILITRAVGEPTVYHYLVFRVRNQATDATQDLQVRAKGYNEVLQAITTQYEVARVTTDGGTRLSVDGVADPAEATIVQREDTRPRQRTVRLSALAYDDRGTRMRHLDAEPGTGPQEAFGFPDLGNVRRAGAPASVREAIEAAVGRRLYTPSELRGIPLDPFDGVQRVAVDDIADPAFDRRGWFVGEVYGVLIFDRFDDHAQRLTIEVQGLSNKFRIRQPPTADGAVPNYAETRVLRRTFVARYDWPGDEFYRHDDAFVPVTAGWEWTSSFQRQARRADVAYAHYFLNNIQDPAGERRPAVEAAFWTYYNQARATRGDRLPDLERLTREQ